MAFPQKAQMGMDHPSLSKEFCFIQRTEERQECQSDIEAKKNGHKQK